MSKTSQQWWDAIKTKPNRFNDWLVKQHRGEVTAAKRIVEFADRFATDDHKAILNRIAVQENMHAEWILELLRARGIEPNIEDAEKRYWKETLDDIVSFETGAAVAAHAEKMRLERISVIKDDVTAPWDVRETFARILKDELFHERAFRDMAGDEAIAVTAGAHKRGRKALGLTA